MSYQSKKSGYSESWLGIIFVCILVVIIFVSMMAATLDAKHPQQGNNLSNGFSITSTASAMLPKPTAFEVYTFEHRVRMTTNTSSSFGCWLLRSGSGNKWLVPTTLISCRRGLSIDTNSTFIRTSDDHFVQQQFYSYEDNAATATNTASPIAVESPDGTTKLP